MSAAAESAAADLVPRLGVKPLPPELLQRALTHASYVNESGESVESNERLEFLGDALLGMVVGHELFRRYPEAGEGSLTRMRADLVRGTTLARVAVRLALGDHIVLGKGEESAGGRARERNLAGAMEAVIGAVYVAHGYRVARSLVLRLLAPELLQVRKEGARIDAKSSLQHMVQARWHEPPNYVTVDETVDGAGRKFTVEVRVGAVALGRGEGSSKREAQQHAARSAVAGLLAESEAN
ncbi:MAG: ribonuclease III [Dehalococcoidia bacterium]|nr:ribonuclease III [Dehalococcoidia bacterium]MCB9486724.1 ribonuclease III [Thermoflexaceae bacterium]